MVKIALRVKKVLHLSSKPWLSGIAWPGADLGTCL